MLSQTLLPDPGLRGVVKCYQIRHFVFHSIAPLPFKPYAPRPEQTLTFYLRAHEIVEYVTDGKFQKRPCSMLMGQQTQRTNRHLGGSDFIVFIVEFHPGLLHQLTGIPFNELTNTFIDAESVLSPEIRKVNSRLCSASNCDEMVKIINAFLRRLVGGFNFTSNPEEKATRILIDFPERYSVDQLAQACCLSSRQLERRFKQRMGVGPKLFTRIARMNKACRLKYSYPDRDWLSVALECGYCDLRHLLRDFADLANVSPTAYFAEDQKAPEKYFGMPDTSMLI